MDKETAEKIVKRLKIEGLLKKSLIGFLWVNLFICGFTIIFFHNLIFVIVLLILALFDIIATIICPCVKNKDKGLTVLTIINFILCCAYLNCLVFSMSKSEDCFVLWAYLLSLSIQVLSVFIGCIVIPKLMAKYYIKDTNVESIKKITIWGSSGMTGWLISSAFIRFFSPSQRILINIISVLMNVICCALLMAIIVWCYKVHLMLKYDIR